MQHCIICRWSFLLISMLGTLLETVWNVQLLLTPKNTMSKEVICRVMKPIAHISEKLHHSINCLGRVNAAWETNDPAVKIALRVGHTPLLIYLPWVSLLDWGPYPRSSIRWSNVMHCYLVWSFLETNRVPNSNKIYNNGLVDLIHY